MRKDGGRALLDALPANADQVQHLLDSSKQELDSAQGTAKSTKRRVQNVAVCEKVPTYQPDLQRDAFAVEVINRVLHGLATCKPDDGAPASEKTCSPRKMNVDTHLRQTTTNPRLPPKSAKGRIPAADAKKHRQQPKASTVATPTASLIACASSAFRCLRDARKHAPGSASGVDSKLETGMLAFIGRLLALGHTETAIVELEALQTLLHCRFNNPGKSQNEDSGTKAANGKCSSILPSLLSFESVPDTPLCLTIATNFQILVLRAMLSTRFAMPTESVSQSLEDASPCSPCSPVTLLLRLAQHPTARDQACRSLETVARLIFALCPSLSSSADELALDRERSPSPSTSFRLQRIYLHAQVSWMHMAGHEGNIDDEIYKPLLRCCKAYARRSQQDAANKYIVLKHSVEGIFNALRTSQLHGDGPARTELYEYLSKVASSVGRNIEAATFLANGSAADTNSTVSRIKLLVKLASLKLRTSPDRLLIDQVNEIAELLMIVQQSASLPPDELMSVMQDLLHLGQIVLPILSTRTQTSSEEAESVREITSCFTIFEAIITTLTRLSALTDEKFRMSAHMVIKTLTFFASSSQASRCIRFGELRIALEQCSQVCAIISSQDVPTVALSAMASTATLPSKTERSPGVATAEKIDMSLRTSASGLSMEQTSLIAISNAYWTLSKQHPEAIMTSDVAVEGMWASLRCLEYQPMEVVKAGQFTNKCLKLGQLLQSLERYQDAASVYTMVIKALVRLDCLVVITNAVSSHSTLQAWAATEDTGHLWQAIESLLQLAARHHVGLPEGQVYYDHIDLNVVQRAALLERQLYLDGKWQKSRILKNRERNIRSAILSTLLQLYDMIRYPVRRARICLHIFRLFIDHAGDLEADVFDAAKGFAAAASPSDFALDISLRQAWDHFHVSVAAIAGMLENNDDENIYNKVVSGWEDLLQGDKSIADLVLRLDNVRSWRDQVIMLIDYLHFHGFFLLELRAVRVLTRLYELQDTKDTAEISYRIRAGRLLLQLGHTSEAGVHLMRARDNFHEASPIPKDILVAHELAFAAYYTDLGNADHSIGRLDSASGLYDALVLEHAELSSSREQKLQNICLHAELLSTRAYQLWELGPQESAVQYQARAVTILQRTWKGLERSTCVQISKSPAEPAPPESIANALSNLRIDDDHSEAQQTTRSKLDTWKIAPILCRSLLDLSHMVFASGLYEDSLHYAQQSLVIAEAVQSTALIGLSLVKKADLLCRSGDIVSGTHALQLADRIYVDLDDRVEAILHHISLGLMHHLEHRWPIELEVYTRASKIIQKLSQPAIAVSVGFSLLQASITAPAKSAAKLPRNPSVTMKNVNRKPTDKSSSASQVDHSDASMLLITLKNRLLRSQAEALLASGDHAGAAQLLQGLGSTRLHGDLRAQLNVTIAKCHLNKGVTGLQSDPTLNMLSESILSLPASIRPRCRGSSMNIAKGVNMIRPKKKPSTCKSHTHAAKSKIEPGMIDRLLAPSFTKAYETTTESTTSLTRFCSVSTITQNSLIATTAALFSSFAFSDVLESAIHPMRVAWSIEIPHSVASVRERAYVDLEAKKPGSSFSEHREEQVASITSAEEELSPHMFQHNFVDIIPSNWTAISLYLDDANEHIHIVRYERGRSPFIVRLPLNRPNAEDPDEETLSFDEAKAELRDIIDSSDATVHAARDSTDSMKQKGAKTKWWSDREALNTRLKDLLVNVENMWFGGFRGLFSQGRYQLDLLARFQQSFENILDQHLPSRQNAKKTKTAKKVALDARVLDLFIGLSNDTNPDVDIDEALTDLLYYVVDILQFNGEPNAYDEIDFDSMVVQTHDALQSYHEAAASQPEQQAPHTILILDKQLHAFPWESMPCLEGHSVSRLTSLYDLRERILAMNSHDSIHELGFHISVESGSYILNPSGDLAKTQSRFQKPLSTLPWTNIINRMPKEDEFLSCLNNSSTNETAHSMLLYFGHGSGAQYVRSRRIKRLRTKSPSSTQPPTPTCNTALLFGCSSASLREVSEFEPFGTPKTYLAAGAPALLGSLWDVTDGDCDAFAGSVLERWGLLEPGACKEIEAGKKKKGKVVGKGKGKASVEEDSRGVRDVGGRRLCLSEAAAKSRGDCYLKYLNGAAMVVYGVPVFLAKE